MPNITIHTTYGEVYIVLLIFLVLIAAGHMRANAKNGRIAQNRVTTSILLVGWVIAAMILLSGGKFLRIP